jgi:hypothetical protein
MMREAQKMMKDPAFQKYMNQMMAAPQFKTAMKSTKEALNDPEKVKELEEKAKAAIELGNQELEELKAAKEGDDDEKKPAAVAKDDAKPAAEEEEEVDDMPEIPKLNLN